MGDMARGLQAVCQAARGAARNSKRVGKDLTACRISARHPAPDQGRIGVTISRDDRKELQDLRDAMRDWLIARDDEREKAQWAVDELSVRASEFRETFLTESRRLAKAGQMAARAAAILKARSHKTAPEAAAFSTSLRTFLVTSRVSTRQ